MKYRTITYFNRKKAFKEMAQAPSLKSLLKAEFYAAKNIIVKKHVLKMYEELNHPETAQKVN